MVRATHSTGLLDEFRDARPEQRRLGEEVPSLLYDVRDRLTFE